MIAPRAYRMGRTAGIPILDRTVDRLWIPLTVVLIAALAIEWALVLAHPTNLQAEIGGDYTIYMDAARRWLAGGSFFAPYQFAGPYELVAPAVLYPPTILALLVPFTLLPAVLWWVIPIGLIAGIVVSWQPARWAWPLIVLCLLWGQTGAILVNGTPTLWIAAFVALGTRWPLASALVMLKPSVFPFALTGLRDRRWWLVGIALAALSLPLLPLWEQWIAVLRNGTGERASVLYSLADAPLLALPLIARWATTAKRP
jgi:hypothetical protein